MNGNGKDQSITRIDEAQHGRQVERRTAGDSVAAKTQIEAAYTMALARPRNMRDCETELIAVCGEFDFAEKAVYRLPRGNKKVQGLSIRFAEEALYRLRNIHVETVVVAEDEHTRTIRQTLIDLEDNRWYSKEFIVDRTTERSRLKDGQTSLGSRLNSEGEVVHLVAATEADMYQKCGILESKAIRDNLMRMIPFRLKKQCLDLALKTSSAGPKGETREDMLRKLAGSFAELGVKVRDIEAWLGHPLEQLTDEERDDLRGIYVAIDEGITSWADAMAEKQGTTRKPARAEGNLAMKPGDNTKHQGHDEAADAAKKSTETKAARAEATSPPSHSSKPGPAVENLDASDDQEPFRESLTLADGSVDEDEEARANAGNVLAAKRDAAVKTEAILEIIRAASAAGLEEEDLPGYAENIGLAKLEAIEQYDIRDLNKILDGLVKGRQKMAQKEHEEEVATNAATKLKAKITTLTDLRKKVMDEVRPCPLPAEDAGWVAKIAARIMPLPFSLPLDKLPESSIDAAIEKHHRMIARAKK